MTWRLLTSSRSGKWNVFTGDNLGALLGSWVFSQYRDSGKPVGKHLVPNTSLRWPTDPMAFADKLAFCASTVSSKLLKAMAAKEGFVFRETLTGFK